MSTGRRLTVKSVYLESPDNRKLVNATTSSETSEEQITRNLETRWKTLTPDAKFAWEIVAKLTRQLRDSTKTLTTISRLPAPTDEPEVEIHKQLETCRRMMAMAKVFSIIQVSVYLKNLTDCKRLAKVVYQNLEWGWNEKVYQEALKYELGGIGYQVVSEIPQTIVYRGVELGDGINVRTDLIVTDRNNGRQLLLELKADMASPVSLRKATQQCRRYLRMKKIPIGLVINFPDKPYQRVRIITVIA
jgi:GxxExxY protein